MRYFEQDGGSIVWRSKNETLVLIPLGGEQPARPQRHDG